MDAKPFRAVTVIAAVCAAVLASTAWACGDKLVALGGGVGFDRVIVSRHPGHIMMLLEPATGLAAANEKFKLAASLTLAGHEVFIVKSIEELHAQRDAAAPDLILVDAARAKQIRFQPVTTGGAPTIMPVHYPVENGSVEAQVQQSGCLAVASGRKGSQLLKAVENALKLRSRGMPMPCEKSDDSRQA